MFAIIQIGSAQFKIQEGDTVYPNRIKEQIGDEITLDKVMLLADEQNVSVGQPYLKDVKVQAKVIQHSLGPKAIAFKYRRRKASASTKGHRQKVTALTITKISAK